MGNKNQKQKTDPKLGGRRILAATDTGSTTTRRVSGASSTSGDFELPSDFGGEWTQQRQDTLPQINRSNWIIDYWQPIAGITVGAAFVVWYASALNTKVETLGSDFKEIKTSIESIKADTVNLKSENLQTQRSIDRIESTLRNRQESALPISPIPVEKQK